MRFGLMTRGEMQVDDVARKGLTEAGYTYYAFVSHSHRDAKWATWIQNALERYRLPSAVRKAVRKPLPKRLAPVFRDVTDLGTGQLVEGLHRELEASRFLIVVCSPDSAKPNAEGKHYVDHEVDYFAELGRADRIIPVIVRGTPEESFCPKIRDSGLLAIDATKASRARVLNDIVAKILGLRPDELWRRERRRQLFRRFVFSGLGVAAALVIAVSCLFAWENGRTVAIDYADYVLAYGLPQGLFRLSDEQVSHRHLHYHFVYQGLKFWPKCVHEDTSGNNPFRAIGFKRVLRRVDQANSAGLPVDADDSEQGERPQVQFFDEYASDGTLRETRHATFVSGGIYERAVKRIVFSDKGGVVNAIAEFKGEDRLELAFARSTDPGGTDAMMKATVSEVAKHVVARDGAGRVKTIAFYNAYGTRTRDSEGVGGHAFERDELGRIVKRTYLDEVGNPRPLKNGVAARAYIYTGRVVTSSCSLGADGNMIRNPYGWARCSEQFDGWGNVIRSEYYDEQGECVLDEIGIAGLTCVYDARGYRTEMRYHGLDGKPCLRTQGDAGWLAEYDDRGLETRKVSLGVDGKPKMGNFGFAECRCTYDASGNPTSMRYYGIDGNPCRRDDGTAGWMAEYDESGRETRNVWIGLDGKPFQVEDGYAEYRCTYDAHGHKTSHRYFSVTGRPCVAVNGTAGWVTEYDVKQRATRNVWMGVDGKPCLCADGYAECRRVYDSYGNQTAQRYYGTDGELCRYKGGNAGWLAEYDEKGWETRTVWFGVDELPCLLAAGYAERRCTYDEWGNKTAERYFGADGKPCLQKDGVAGWLTEYDAVGRRTRIVAIGVDDRPTLSKSGWAEIRCAYDETGKMIDCTAFDQHGRKVGGK